MRGGGCYDVAARGVWSTQRLTRAGGCHDMAAVPGDAAAVSIGKKKKKKLESNFIGLGSFGHYEWWWVVVGGIGWYLGGFESFWMVVGGIKW
jgi:hypothetical protein